MNLDLRSVLRAAIIALAVGLCVNVYGISTTDLVPLQAIGMAAIFCALLV